ncbi:hypothetical protein [Chondromyces apiculatus]|uniref:Uncharacterized protein n=1 Tax=Chondromyces apiculatus DSM 436 TaxID=1192034 RepID=A0A017T029_9BACT|nr:hypothetical protein [Chondromyces apiculatus]EYF02543.1 Hypothetical protein CAP_6750 [Chondromyces apiculatus DSM 436]
MMLDATERRALVGSSLVATTLLCLPRQWVSAGIAAVLTIALYTWHVRRSAREAAAAPKPPQPAAPAEAAPAEAAPAEAAPAEAAPSDPAPADETPPRATSDPPPSGPPRAA